MGVNARMALISSFSAGEASVGRCLARWRRISATAPDCAAQAALDRAGRGRVHRALGRDFGAPGGGGSSGGVEGGVAGAGGLEVNGGLLLRGSHLERAGGGGLHFQLLLL